MHPLMAARGHRLVTPTYTGLGERAHLANPDIDLETHIADVLAVLEIEDLSRRQSDRPFLWRHGCNRRRRPRARAHQATHLSRRLRARMTAKACSTCCRRVSRAQRKPGADGWRIPPTADAARHAAGRRRLVQAAPRAAAGQDLHAETAFPERPADVCRAITSIARASRPTTASGRSTSAPSARAGAPPRSTPATTRMSPVRRCWRICSPASLSSFSCVTLGAPLVPGRAPANRRSRAPEWPRPRRTD